MTNCGRHRHDTVEGAARCAQDRADKRVARRQHSMGPVVYRREVFRPARPEQRGPFTVWVFQRGVVDA